VGRRHCREIEACSPQPFEFATPRPWSPSPGSGFADLPGELVSTLERAERGGDARSTRPRLPGASSPARRPGTRPASFVSDADRTRVRVKRLQIRPIATTRAASRADRCEAWDGPFFSTSPRARRATTSCPGELVGGVRVGHTGTLDPGRRAPRPVACATRLAVHSRRPKTMGTFRWACDPRTTDRRGAPRHDAPAQRPSGRGGAPQTAIAGLWRCPPQVDSSGSMPGAGASPRRRRVVVERFGVATGERWTADKVVWRGDLRARRRARSRDRSLRGAVASCGDALGLAPRMRCLRGPGFHWPARRAPAMPLARTCALGGRCVPSLRCRRVVPSLAEGPVGRSPSRSAGPCWGRKRRRRPPAVWSLAAGSG
jgi:hypothetical protein